jgi:hypothetical protein
MKKIIVINGSGTSGKDEIAKIAQSFLKIKVKVISSVDKVKEIAEQLGWYGHKNDLGRKFLSDLKDAWTNFNNGPLMDISKKIDELDSNQDWLIFVHIREPEEIYKIKNFTGLKDNHGEIVTLLIRRSNIEKFNNHADQEVEEYPYDYIIENNGTLYDLKEHVRLFLEDIKMI